MNILYPRKLIAVSGYPDGREVMAVSQYGKRTVLKFPLPSAATVMSGLTASGVTALAVGIAVKKHDPMSRTMLVRIMSF